MEETCKSTDQSGRKEGMGSEREGERERGSCGRRRERKRGMSFPAFHFLFSSSIPNLILEKMNSSFISFPTILNELDISIPSYLLSFLSLRQSSQL